MVPELVTVPTVFSGAGLPHDASYGRLLSSIDILPTALAAVGRTVPPGMDCLNLWNTGQTRTEPIYSDVWKPSSFDSVHYKASSMWSEMGGLLHNHSPKLSRFAFAVGHHYYLAPYAGIMRRSGLRGVRDILSCYGKNIIEYGEYSGPGDIDRVKTREFTEGGRRPAQTETRSCCGRSATSSKWVIRVGEQHPKDCP